MVPDLTFFAVPGREEALGMVPDVDLESALPATFVYLGTAAVNEEVVYKESLAAIPATAAHSPHHQNARSLETHDK